MGSHANKEPPRADASASPPPKASEEQREAERARDRQLVRRLKQGDERAFQEMVRSYQHRIFGLIFRMIGNRQEAEDLAQEVFISVYRNIDRYRGEGKLYTWLYRIATNTCRNRIKYLKHRQYNRREDVDSSPTAHLAGVDNNASINLQSHVPGPEATVEGNRLQGIIQRELEELEPEHRLLIVLRDVQGLAYQDILDITGLQEGTLKSRLHRARVALKTRLEPHLR